MMTELQYARPMRRLRGALPAALLAVSLLAASPSWMRAAGEAQSLPAEPGAHQLPGLSFGGAVADIDGDGVRDLVRLVSEPGAGGRLAVDAWRVGGDGAVEPMGAVRLRRGASVDEVLDGFRQIDRDQMLPLGIDEPARLVIWHDGRRERLLVVTIGTDGLPVACCLTVWGVEMGRAGLTLALLANTQDNATSVRAVDMDGDGTDELFLTVEPEVNSPNLVPVRALRWESGRFRQLRSQFVAAPGWEAFAPIESDGRPGSEVLISADRVDNGPGAVLYRMWLADDAIRVESEPVSDRGQLAAVDTPDGRRLVLVPPEAGSTVELDWPAGGLIRRTEATAVNGRLLGVLGRAAAARVLVAAERDVLAGFDVYDDGLDAELTTTMSPAALQFAGGPLRPYAGPMPGGLPDGQPAFVFGGQLLTSAGSAGVRSAVNVAPTASLPGTVPLGVLGPDGGWMALLPIDGYDASRGAGVLASRRLIPAAPITLAPTSVALATERDDGALRAGFPDLVTADGGRTLLSGSGSIRVEVAAPSGSRVVLNAGLPSPNGPPPTRLTMRSDRQQIELPAMKDELDAGRMRLSVTVVTPAGHGYSEVRKVELRLRPPRLDVAVEGSPLSFDVQLTGATARDAAITVDGRPVAVGDTGQFSADLEAGLLPRDVRVKAVDPVGNATQRLVSIVAPIDYRQLPWVAIVAVLTVAAGGLLLLRVPRLRPDPPREPGDDGRLEEID